jgi:uncharacterized protein (TIGR02996 family)
MTDRDALLNAVLAGPDDDLPRLVFADWCDEHGEPDRAEFVRVQVRLAVMDGPPDTTSTGCCDHCGLPVDVGQEHAPDCEYDALRRRAAELFDRGTDAGGFLDVVPAAWGPVHWRRGFIEGLTRITAADAVAHLDAVLAAHPVTDVTLTRLDSRSICDLGGLAAIRLGWRIGDPQHDDLLSEALKALWPRVRTWHLPPEPTRIEPEPAFARL